ncbi:MAG: hypothetical protein MAG581_01133 [Deltaproteobacteria bacterium]|jgi:cell division protein FtsN|nr:hypothetical protein [Deltaproteobacteria bacterium]
MQESQGKKVFRIHLSLPIVVLLISLSTFSLVAVFYLGMVTEKSMQRPPEYPDVDTDISADKPLSEEDLKFFGLSERKKDQESLDLEELRVLKKKTEELTKTPEKPDLKTPKKPEPVTPEKPKSAEAEKTELSKTEISKPEKPEVPKSDSKIVTSPASPDAVKTPVVQKPAAVTKKDARYTVQVFASRKHENAKKLVEKLRKNGFDDAFIFQHTAGNKTLYRVRVGKLERSETKELANKLKNLKYIDSVQITRF